MGVLRGTLRAVSPMLTLPIKLQELLENHPRYLAAPRRDLGPPTRDRLLDLPATLAEQLASRLVREDPILWLAHPAPSACRAQPRPHHPSRHISSFCPEWVAPCRGCANMLVTRTKGSTSCGESSGQRKVALRRRRRPSAAAENFCSPRQEEEGHGLVPRGTQEVRITCNSGAGPMLVSWEIG